MSCLVPCQHTVGTQPVNCILYRQCQVQAWHGEGSLTSDSTLLGEVIGKWRGCLSVFFSSIEPGNRITQNVVVMLKIRRMFVQCLLYVGDRVLTQLLKVSTVFLCNPMLWSRKQIK